MINSVAEYPDILCRWDYQKNNIKPSEVKRYSKTKVWLNCPICGNSREYIIANLKKNVVGCAVCHGNKYYFLGKDGTYAIYVHTTPDGKKYIGMTNHPIKIRFGRGKHYYTPRFAEAIQKYGWDNITHEILEYGLSEDQASESEKKYIQLFNTLNPQFGYNIAIGGRHGAIYGRQFSDESKEKMRISHLGKKATLETKRKLSESHKNLDGNNKRSVFKMDKDGHVIEEYLSIKQAAHENNICDSGSIIRVCKGIRKTAGGFCWKYKE